MQALAAATLRSAIAFPKLFRRPRLLLLWLLRAHTAQVVLIASLLLMPHIVPGAADRLLEMIYRPVSTKVLGVLPVRQQNPKLDLRKAQVHRGLKYGSGLLVLMAFWLSIPAAFRRGEAIANDCEARADQLIHSTPSRSVLLYRKALTFTADELRCQTLRDKLEKLDRNLAGSGLRLDATVAMDRVAPAEGESGNVRTPDRRYVIDRELGRGGMGVVLLARDSVLEREVAIKELPHAVADDPQLSKRFRREAQALARLNHPGIVQVYDFSQFRGSSWIIMEYVKGVELGKLASRTGKMDAAEVMRLGQAMAEALQYAHDRGVLHRDLKPANVLVDKQGNPKIMDFGVAHFAMSSPHTQPGAILGSPAYMSPEQARGDCVDVRSDVYALGVVLYELLTGEGLFDGTVQAVIAQVLGRTPEPIDNIIEGLPPRLSKLVMSMLAKDPEQRPGTMARVQEELKQLLAHLN